MKKAVKIFKATYLLVFTGIVFFPWICFSSSSLFRIYFSPWYCSSELWCFLPTQCGKGGRKTKTYKLQVGLTPISVAQPSIVPFFLRNFCLSGSNKLLVLTFFHDDSGHRCLYANGKSRRPWMNRPVKQDYMHCDKFSGQLSPFSWSSHPVLLQNGIFVAFKTSGGNYVSLKDSPLII